MNIFLGLEDEDINRLSKMIQNTYHGIMVYEPNQRKFHVITRVGHDRVNISYIGRTPYSYKFTTLAAKGMVLVNCDGNAFTAIKYVEHCGYFVDENKLVRCTKQCNSYVAQYEECKENEIQY